MTQRKSVGKVEVAAKPRKKAARKNTPPKQPPRKIGRPELYTQELADAICAELASGKSMRTVCKEDRFPCMVTVFMWLRTRPEFLKQYEKAKEEASDALVEEMLDIADDGTNDWMEIHDKEGAAAGYKVNGEHVQRSRLRVDTRKWIAAKLKPKKYGEKVDVNHGNQPDNPLKILMEQIGGTKFRVKDDSAE